VLCVCAVYVCVCGSEREGGRESASSSERTSALSHSKSNTYNSVRVRERAPAMGWLRLVGSLKL